MIWGGIAGRWAKKRTISVNQLHFSAACFYGLLLNFNIFQSCQVVSVLFGLDRRRRIVRDYLDMFSVSPAAQQRICGVQFWQFQTQQAWSQVPLEEFNMVLDSNQNCIINLNPQIHLLHIHIDIENMYCWN